MIVLIGAGGIGAPAVWALCEAGVQALRVVDDDIVELSNLHRQILFDDEDTGRPKLEALARAMAARYPQVSLDLRVGRALPDTVLDVIDGASVVVDATDNFASRFLLADAAHISGVPIVHAASVQWKATVMAVAAAGRPCYRCLFEDLPSGDQLDCATAGVVGPVCGVAGAVAADAALRVVAGDDTVFGRITTYDGLRDRLRDVAVAPRADCPLCLGSIVRITGERYMGAVCS